MEYTEKQSEKSIYVFGKNLLKIKLKIKSMALKDSSTFRFDRNSLDTFPNDNNGKVSKEEILHSIEKFLKWLDDYGLTSQDQYDFWAAPNGQRAKAMYYKNPLLGFIMVTPYISLDTFWPSSRKWFYQRQRFPIADAHYAMGFLCLYEVTSQFKYYDQATYFLDFLKETKCPGYENYGWGYPFDWMTIGGLIKRFTPLITTTPYVYEAFSKCYDINGDDEMLRIMESIARHVAFDYHDTKIGNNISACSYIPQKELENLNFNYVVNANSYRAFMLIDAAIKFDNEKYWDIANRNLNFVLNSQRSDGSWLYSTDGKNSFIDHFHSCFVLKNLTKIKGITGNPACGTAIEKGVRFYFKHLLDKNNLPLPFAKNRRFSPYKKELYDFAESLNLSILLLKEFTEFEKVIESQLSDLLYRWQHPAGFFRTRQLLTGWHNTPYHRWAQSQLFRSLSFLLAHLNENGSLS